MLEILLIAVLILLTINLALDIACKIAKVIALSGAKKELESDMRELASLMSGKDKDPERVPAAPKVAKKKVVRRK